VDFLEHCSLMHRVYWFNYLPNRCSGLYCLRPRQAWMRALPAIQMQGTNQTATSGAFCARLSESSAHLAITTQRMAHFLRPPLSLPIGRTFSQVACDQTDRAGSASLALRFKLSGKCCGRPIRRSLTLAPSADQDRYGAAFAFLRYCPSYASLRRVQLSMN